MSLDPFKKELEAIDQDLEIAMSHLSESSQRVDDLLADFNADRPSAARRAEIIPLDLEPETPDDGGDV